MRFRFIKKILVLLIFIGIFCLLTTFDRVRQLKSPVNSAAKKAEFLTRVAEFVKSLNKTTTTHFTKISWENYTQVKIDQQRMGFGEQGKAANLKKSTLSKAQIKALYDQNGFNAAVSDVISVHRSVRDMRYEQCKKILYEEILPTVSIIIPMYEEHWTTILRTVHSLIDRAPRELLKELILVDDCSKKKFLGKKLDDYMSEHYSNLVKIIRNKNREGLIRSRVIGAHAARGEVLIFIDSHCEPQYNWLPPLVEPIKFDHKIVTCPFIDVINEDTFKMVPQDEGARGAFDWKMFYKRLPRLPESQKYPEKPFDSPVMAGGLFAIHKDWFWKLGGYDEGLDVWGGEQYELSFKVWMCGGKIIDVPCSRIGHVYRKFSPLSTPFNLDKNIKRVAEVWMDDWKQYVYKDNVDYYQKLDAGNLDKQKAIREKLQCKSFDWFMKYVAFDLRKHYPEKIPENIGQGQISTFSNAQLCLEASKDPIKLATCTDDDLNHEQQLLYGWHLDIQIVSRSSFCLDYNTDNNDNKFIASFECHHEGQNQKWLYNLETKQFYHPTSKECIQYSVESHSISMAKCDVELPTQKWNFHNMNVDIYKTYLKEQSSEE